MNAFYGGLLLGAVLGLLLMFIYLYLTQNRVDEGLNVDMETSDFNEIHP